MGFSKYSFRFTSLICFVFSSFSSCVWYLFGVKSLFTFSFESNLDGYLFFFFDALLAVFAVSSSFPSRDEDRVVKALETPRAATVVGVAVVVRQKPPTRRTTSLNREEVKEIEDFELSSSCFSIRFISFSPLFCVDINFF